MTRKKSIKKNEPETATIKLRILKAYKNEKIIYK